MLINYLLVDTRTRLKIGRKKLIIFEKWKYYVKASSCKFIYVQFFTFSMKNIINSNVISLYENNIITKHLDGNIKVLVFSSVFQKWFLCESYKIFKGQ